MKGKEEGAVGGVEVPTGMSILVVDDHDLMRNMLVTSLRDAFPSFEIPAATTGEGGIVLCRVCQPLVVVMDFNLPGINGIEATRQIKSMLPGTAVVMCSFCDDPSVLVAALEAGADEWITKEQASDGLILAIQRHLEARGEKTQVAHRMDEPHEPLPGYLPASSVGSAV